MCYSFITCFIQESVIFEENRIASIKRTLETRLPLVRRGIASKDLAMVGSTCLKITNNSYINSPKYLKESCEFISNELGLFRIHSIICLFQIDISKEASSFP